jgi:hypothetical protein
LGGGFPSRQTQKCVCAEIVREQQAKARLRFNLTQSRLSRYSRNHGMNNSIVDSLDIAFWPRAEVSGGWLIRQLMRINGTTSTLEGTAAFDPLTDFALLLSKCA